MIAICCNKNYVNVTSPLLERIKTNNTNSWQWVAKTLEVKWDQRAATIHDFPVSASQCLLVLLFASPKLVIRTGSPSLPSHHLRTAGKRTNIQVWNSCGRPDWQGVVWEWVGLLFPTLSSYHNFRPACSIVFASSPGILFMFFSTIAPPFWPLWSGAKHEQERGGKPGLPGHWVSSEAHFMLLPYLVGLCWIFLQEKSCSSVTTRGTGIVVAVGTAARKIFIVCSEWLWAHHGFGYACCLKVLGVLELDPALVGQTVVNDKVDGCRMQRVMALAARSLQVLVLWLTWLLRKSRCAPPWLWSGLLWFPGPSLSWPHWPGADGPLPN